MATPVYLGVWNCLTPISNEEAAHQYQLLKDVGSERRFDDKVYAFYTRLIGLYPEVETLSEDELDDSPWASSMEVSDSHVVMAVVPEKFEKVVPQVLALAEENGLVCFDSQAGKVYLPPHLVAKQTDAAPAETSSIQSEPEPSPAETSSVQSEPEPSPAETSSVQSEPEPSPAETSSVQSEPEWSEPSAILAEPVPETS